MRSVLFGLVVALFVASSLGNRAEDRMNLLQSHEFSDVNDPSIELVQTNSNKRFKTSSDETGAPDFERVCKPFATHYQVDHANRAIKFNPFALRDVHRQILGYPVLKEGDDSYQTWGDRKTTAHWKRIIDNWTGIRPPVEIQQVYDQLEQFANCVQQMSLNHYKIEGFHEKDVEAFKKRDQTFVRSLEKIGLRGFRSPFNKFIEIVAKLEMLEDKTLPLALLPYAEHVAVLQPMAAKLMPTRGDSRRFLSVQDETQFEKLTMKHLGAIQDLGLNLKMSEDKMCVSKHGPIALAIMADNEIAFRMMFPAFKSIFHGEQKKKRMCKCLDRYRATIDDEIGPHMSKYLSGIPCN